MQQLLPLLQKAVNQAQQILPLIQRMLLDLKGSKKNARRVNPPLAESAFQLPAVQLDGDLLFTVFVNLIDDEIQRFAPFTESFRKGEIILGLHMIVIHDIKNDISQMERRMRCCLMSVIRGIHAGSVHQNPVAPQQRDILPHGNRCIFPALAAKILELLRRCLPW
ncbi:hypothetical protein D3C73_1108360 [compost metagenome]